MGTKQNWMLAIVALVFSALASAGSIIYNVNLTIGGGSAAGTITTDGTIGVLSAADITDFDLMINDGTASMTLEGPLSGNDSYVIDFGGSSLSATATALSFNFSAAAPDVLAFRLDTFANPGSGEVCFVGSDNCAGDSNAELVCEIVTAGCESSAVASKSGTQVIATVASVPEPSSLMLLGLGCAALLIHRNRAALARLCGDLSRRF